MNRWIIQREANESGSRGNQTWNAATLDFAGTEVKDALVTGVTYKKANAEAAFSVAVTPEVAKDGIKKSAKEVAVTVSPDAKAGE